MFKVMWIWESMLLLSYVVLVLLGPLQCFKRIAKCNIAHDQPIRVYILGVMHHSEASRGIAARHVVTHYNSLVRRAL